MQEIEYTLSSREVAGMIKKDHSKLMRDIRTYIEQLAESKIGLGDFFKESVYIDGNNQPRPCYLITMKGCEFIANKLTGAKGTEFTARYINRFHEMEDFISGQVPAVAPVPPDQMQILSQKQEKLEKELGKMKADMHRFRLDKGSPVFSITCNSRYPYKTMIMSMLGRVDDVRDEIFLSQMYTLFKKHMEKVSI